MVFLTISVRSMLVKRIIATSGVCIGFVVLLVYIFSSQSKLHVNSFPPEALPFIAEADSFQLENLPVSITHIKQVEGASEYINQAARIERDSELVSSIVPKKVLIWNSYWQSKALWHKIFFEIVHKQCPQSNCILTTDHSQVNTSDAVLFHLVDIVAENYTFPATRDPNQIWIGMTYEPPYILQFTGIDFTRLNGVFNRTMSYRSDGDIVVRHGTYSPLQLPLPATYTSPWINSHESIEKRNYADGKRRLVSWFASSRNCKSQSGREKYVEELQNYIQVDIYGSCGPYKCGLQKTMRNPYKVEEDDCYMLVSIGYKFVLAFENSLCEDYVTEKLYNNLKLNAVPVVLGASNYSVFAPPHSVIEASKYSPEELAEYLQFLDKNNTAYNEYFNWKQNFEVEAHDGVPLACDLCEQLHNPNWQVEKKVYDQFDKWITSGCKSGYGVSS